MWIRESFICKGELGKAEKLYKRALDSRQVDWAKLGMARVKQLQKDLEVSGRWLEEIVADNPLYLPAYDFLAKTGSILVTTRKSRIPFSDRSIYRQSLFFDNRNLPKWRMKMVIYARRLARLKAS